MYAFDDVGLLCGASPTNSVLDDSLHVFILVGGIGFVSGLKIEDLAVAAGERTTAAEDLAAVEPTDKNDVIGRGNVESLAVHLLGLKHKGLGHTRRDGMVGRNSPDSLSCLVTPLEIAGSTHKATEYL